MQSPAPKFTSHQYYNGHTTVKRSDPPVFASTGYPSFLTSATMPYRKPSTAGWLDAFANDLSLIQHRPYRYNPRPVPNIEPIYTGWQHWPKLKLRTDF